MKKKTYFNDMRDYASESLSHGGYNWPQAASITCFTHHLTTSNNSKKINGINIAKAITTLIFFVNFSQDDGRMKKKYA